MERPAIESGADLDLGRSRGRQRLLAAHVDVRAHPRIHSVDPGEERLDDFDRRDPAAA